MAGPKAIDLYEKVRAKVDKGEGVVQAIHKTAKESKLSAGTVQNSYYRVARDRHMTRGLQAQKSRMEARDGKSVVLTNGASTDADAIMNNIMSAIQEPIQELIERNRELEEKASRLTEVEQVLHAR